MSEGSARPAGTPVWAGPEGSIARPLPGAGAAPARGRSVEASGHERSEARRVLVVEPDVGTRSLLQFGLVREGFEVVAARSAEEASRALDPGLPLPGLVMAEVGLSGADGFALCERLRAEGRTAHVPVLLLDARPVQRHRERASGVGADDYLAKPLFLADVVTLARLKAGRSAHDETLESTTEILPLGSVLRALLAGMRSGRLRLGVSGECAFRGGEVISAQFEGVRRAPGLRRMLMLGQGPYAVHLGPVEVESELAFTLRTLCGPLGEELRAWERLASLCVPLEATLVPADASVRPARVALPPIADEVIRLCDGVRTLRDVVLACPLTETETLRTVTRLYATGALVPASLAGRLRAARAGSPVLRTAWDVGTPEQPEVSFGGPALAEPPRWEPGAERTGGVPLPDGWDKERVPTELERASRAGLEPPQRSVPGPRLDVVAPASSRARPPAAVAPGHPAAAAFNDDAEAPVGRTRLRGVLLGMGAVAVAAVVGGASSLLAPAHGGSAGVRGPRLLAGVGSLRSAPEWCRLARERFDAGDPAAAEAAAMKAVALDARDASGHLLLGRILLVRGASARAQAELGRVLQLQPRGDDAIAARALLAQLSPGH